MKKELITELLLQFESARYEINGAENWGAMELQQISGRSKKTGAGRKKDS